MLRSLLLAKAAVVAATVMLAAPAPADAQFGFYSGGGGKGGNRWGISIGQPNYYGGNNYGGNRYGSPYYNQGYGYQGYPGYYRPYGYNSYGYSPYNQGSYYYSQPAPVYITPVTNQSYYPPETVTPAPAAAPATVEVRVPADAELWFDGTKTSQTGSQRIFATPPLPPGQAFTYEVRATWMSGGAPMSQIRKVQVQAGQTSVVTFTE